MKPNQFLKGILLLAVFAINIPASHCQTLARGHMAFGANQTDNGTNSPGACSGSLPGVCDVQQAPFSNSVPVIFTAIPVNDPGKKGYYTLKMQIDIRLLMAYEPEQYKLFVADDQNSDAGSRYVLGSSYTLPQYFADELFPNTNDMVILPKGLPLFIPTLPTQGGVSIVLGTVQLGLNSKVNEDQVKKGEKLTVQAAKRKNK